MLFTVRRNNYSASRLEITYRFRPFGRSNCSWEPGFSRCPDTNCGVVWNWLVKSCRLRLPYHLIHRLISNKMYGSTSQDILGPRQVFCLQKAGTYPKPPWVQILRYWYRSLAMCSTPFLTRNSSLAFTKARGTGESLLKLRRNNLWYRHTRILESRTVLKGFTPFTTEWCEKVEALCRTLSVELAEEAVSHLFTSSTLD